MSYTHTDLAADMAADAARSAAAKHYSERTPAEQEAIDADRLRYVIQRAAALFDTELLDLLIESPEAIQIMHTMLFAAHSECVLLAHKRLVNHLKDRAAEMAGAEYDKGVSA